MVSSRSKNSGKSRSRRIRMMSWSIVLIFASAIALPFTTYFIVDGPTAAQAQVTGDTNQRSNYWRVVRDGGAGYSSVMSNNVNIETNMLFNPEGQNWRQIRNGWITNYGGWALFGIAVLIMLFFILRGRIDLDEPLSGKTVPRWTFWERTLHWYTAILFIVLTITGLSMLFGRALAIPLLGPELFAVWASFSISVHNAVGPFFAIGPLLMLIFWVRHNIPTGTDFKWFVQGGGMIGKKHPSAGKANGGEKVWFWVVILLGLVAVCYTGFALIGWVQEYFGLENSRETYQVMHIWHSVCALVWIAIFMGHVYIGTFGSQGSLDAMTKGHVSIEWAKQHHDMWYEKVKDQASSDTSEAPASGETATS